jgi:hypothetical protein
LEKYFLTVHTTQTFLLSQKGKQIKYKMPQPPSPSATPSSGTHPLAPASSLDPSYAINILANAATADHPSSQAPARTQSQKSNIAAAGGDASDPESDVELVSQIHPDLLMQHQNQLSMQHQVCYFLKCLYLYQMPVFTSLKFITNAPGHPRR